VSFEFRSEVVNGFRLEIVAVLVTIFWGHRGWFTAEFC